MSSPDQQPTPPASLVASQLGMRPRAGGGFTATIWAPDAEAVAVALTDDTAPRSMPAQRSDDRQGLWMVDLPEVGHGDGYLIEVDGASWPDPWSRWQPDGMARGSAAVDPRAIGAIPPGTGTRPGRPSQPLADAVLYELHVGAFTAGGGLRDVIDRLDDLVDLGITHIELMPVAQFPGRHGWGYDGIFWSAVHHAYGGPAALVALVDAAHERGLGVILDVVFNHVGPTGDGIYEAFGPFFTDHHQTAWGPGINVDGAGSDVVRETIFQAATWWVGEVGVDGLRVDACHAIADQSARHVLAELTDRVRGCHPGALLIAESGRNDPLTVTSEQEGGWGFDADWADDFHHALVRLLRDDDRGWLADFGAVADLAKALARPYVHDGTWSGYRKRRFGAPAGHIPAERFVVFSQNHDQIGNRPVGDRLTGTAARLAAFCTLLSPFTPQLFMGEELGTTTPFPFFSDHTDPYIAQATTEGRLREFAAFAAAEGETVPDPQDPDTYERSWLDGRGDAATRQFYADLIRTRATLPRVEPAIRHDEAGRWLRVERGDTVLVANFGPEAVVVPCPEGVVAVSTHAPRPWTTVDGTPGLALPACSGALVRIGDRR
ncbi:malto-oligosyltrehalose trehalohydrolase [Aquihabitans daechungensis]|uniref:malto-oligosyltrehalose trehalohydrolase n=1 Tax=Aquihabitans daechungensis TaxID=1052257 RepID=UPI003BA188D3